MVGVKCVHVCDDVLQQNGVAASISGDVSSGDEPTDHTHKKAKVRVLYRL